MAAFSIRPLDIVFLAPVALPGPHGIGGIQSIVSRQARWLAGRGHRVRVVTSAHPSGVPSITEDGVTYLFIGLDKGLGRATGHIPFTVSRWRTATLEAWPALLADGVPDVVHGHAEAELGLVSAGLIGRRPLVAPGGPPTRAVTPGSDLGSLARRLPALSTLYGSTLSGVLDHIRMAGASQDTYGAGVWLRVAVKAERSLRGALGVMPTVASARLLRRTRVVALSHRHATMVKLSYGLRQVAVISPGVDTVLFHPPASSVRNSIRARFGIGEGEFTWGVVGRVASGKGVLVAIAALARLDDGVPQRDRLFVAGTGPLEPAARALADSLGLTDRVTWAGEVEPPAAAYMCTDALLFPTLHEESFGLAALEAMSCGVPVIARARGAVPEVVAGAGALVRDNDPSAWAAAMAGLRSDENARAAMGAAGRLRAVRAHNRLRTVLALEHHYRDVAAQNRGP